MMELILTDALKFKLWSNTKGRLVDFQTKRAGVPFDGCSRLERSAQCQTQRPFGRLKLGNPSRALEWMFFFLFASANDLFVC
jgi:hypothetical protein